MNNRELTARYLAGLRLPFMAGVALVGMLCAAQAIAQVPARFYWKSLSGANAVPVVAMSMSGNTNPLDYSHTVSPGASIEAEVALAGFAHTFSVGDRAAMAAILVPMGRISGEVTVAGQAFKQSSRGYGDPMLELGINVIGPKAQKNIPDVLRYEPGFSLDIIGDLAIPIGEYDASQPLNLGQNRWYGRLGAPIVAQLGPWVPGRRTTLEFLPAVWMFGTNSNYVGHTLKTDPMFQLDAHLTRDFTEHFWGSIDAVWYKGGGSTIDGVPGGKLNNVGLGYTLGYQINDNVQLTFGYKSTLNDSAPGDLQLDQFMVSLVFGWHPLLEGARRLKGEK